MKPVRRGRMAKLLGGVIIPCVMALGAVLCAAAQAKAATPEGTIYAFGDSLLDLRYVCPVEYNNSSGACGNGKGLLDYLPHDAPFTFNIENDHASGGAGTGSFNVAAIILPQVAQGTLTQIQNFAAAGGHINPQDLTLVSGRNDFYQFLFNPALTGPALAQSSLSNVSQEMSALVSVGASNIVYFDSWSPGAPMTAEVASFEQLFSAGLPAALAPYARPGVRIRLFNLTGLTSEVEANPTQYGFSTGVSCAADPGCETGSQAFQDQHFLYDQHPTETGYSVISQYIANLDASDDALAAQTSVAASAADNFATVLLQRASIGAQDGSTQGVFVDGGYARANQGSWYGNYGTALGYGDNIASTVVGYSRKVAPDTIAAVAFGYGHSSASLDNGDGSILANSYEGGAYVDWRPDRFFLDATLAIARHDLNVSRPGVVDYITATPDGWTVTPNVLAGWLAGCGSLKIGPVAQFSYDHTHIGSYAEQGDPVLTQGVDATGANTFNIQGGLRIEPGEAFAYGIRGYLQATASHDFSGGNQVLETYETYAPGLPVYTVIGPGWDNSTYGLFEGALTSKLTPRANAYIQFSTTAFRGGGNNTSAELGVRIFF